MPVDIDDKRSILRHAKDEGLLGNVKTTPTVRRPRRGKMKAEEIDRRIALSKGQHSKRIGMIRDVMDKYKRIYKNLDKDAKDTKTPLIKTPRGEAIVDVMFSLLTFGAELTTQILPLKTGAQEQALCTKLERGLGGVQFEIESRTGKVPYHDGVHWFLVKGMGVWRTYYRPSPEGVCPLYVEALDPQFVYPVEEDRLLWVVDERERYVGELRENLKVLRKARKGRLAWKVPSFEDKQDTDKITVLRYTDEDWEALKIGEEYVYIRPNLLDFIPYAIGKCRRTPDSDTAWQAQGILAPMLALLELETEILTKYGTAMSLFFYPHIIGQTPDNRAIVFSATPGNVDNIPYETKLTVMNLASNREEITALMSQAQALMSLIGMPMVMFGEPPGQVQAGYPMSLLMGAASRRLDRERGQLEWGLSRCVEHQLRMIDKFGGLDGGFPVYVQPEEGKRGRKALMSLTDKDVAGHFRAKVTLSPKLPQDYMQLATIARLLRQENKLGEPLVSDRWIREDLFEMGSPEEEEERIFEQRMRKEPEVLAHEIEKWKEDWRKREGIKTEEEKLAAVRPLVMPRGMPGMLGEGAQQGMYPEGATAGIPSQVMPPAMAGIPPTMPGEETPEDLIGQMGFGR